MNVEKILHELTIEEKIALVSGTDFMYTNPIKRLNINSIRMSDGPHGLRVQNNTGDNGVTGSNPSTCFPTAATTASSWNVLNLYKMGEAIGQEALYYGIDVVLGPGVCIKRNPLCGRNFEYFSEDPFLSGKLGVSEVDGIQKNNVGVSVKHFALNNAENYRFLGDSICDERAIREIYLKAFEMIVKGSKPDTIMCSYNKINGEYSSDNSWLLNKVLRNDWGYDGLVMSDWGATHNRVDGVKAGLDLEMPGDTDICRKWLVDAINNGTLSEETFDKCVSNVLKLVDKYSNNKQNLIIDWDKHSRIAQEIAEDSAVLLKNDGSLPLSNSQSILVVGDLFSKMRYQGSGSSMINPNYLISPKNAFDSNNVNYEFERGYCESEIEPNYDLIDRAIEKAVNYEKILIFIGLTDYVESEGCDRCSMSLPNNQLKLIESLVKLNKKIILVMFGGSSVELPFKEKVNAILNMYLPGQSGGLATYNLLFGNVSPSGKLAETWVKSYNDVPFGNEYSKNEYELYKESIFVGYRYYLSKNIQVNYPFGYGLSYTNFKYSNIQLNKTDKEIIITCDVENIGDYDGKEVVELYVKGPNSVFKPIKELKGFNKILINKGETKSCEIIVNIDDLRYWNIKEHRWILEDGIYKFEVSSSSDKCELEYSMYLKGEKISSPYNDEINRIYRNCEFEKLNNNIYEEFLGRKLLLNNKRMPITLESRFSDLKNSKLLGRIIYKAVINVAKRQLKEANKLSDGVEKENKIKGAIFLERVLNSNSIITMTMCGGKSMPYNYAEGFVNFANGKLFKGIKCFMNKIEAPILPKYKEVNNEK